MRAMTILKRIIDAAMYILFLLLMGQYALNDAPHEWIGISVGVLFIVHNVLNYKWYRSLVKGKYNTMRIIQLAVNILLLSAMILCMISGIIVSRHIFAVGSGKAIELGRHMHLVATSWAFVLMNIHLGSHWQMFCAISKKVKVGEKAKKVLHIVCCVSVAVLFAYGVYQFIDRRFWEELFCLIDYQKEYDYSRSLTEYLIGTAALSVPFIATAHYAKKLLTSRKHKTAG